MKRHPERSEGPAFSCALNNIEGKEKGRPFALPSTTEIVSGAGWHFCSPATARNDRVSAQPEGGPHHQAEIRCESALPGRGSSRKGGYLDPFHNAMGDAFFGTFFGKIDDRSNWLGERFGLLGHALEMEIASTNRLSYGNGKKVRLGGRSRISMPQQGNST